MSELVSTGYAFDAPEFEIPLNVRRPNDPKRESEPVFVTHVLRRPTDAQLEAREKRSSAETTTIGTEEQLEASSIAPDLELWGQCVTRLKGYRGLGSNPAEFADYQPEWNEKIPPEHKLAVIRAALNSECEVINDELADGFFDVTADTIKVKQRIHGIDVLHMLRKPSEREYSNFQPAKLSLLRKGKATTTKIRGNLAAYTELYDKLIQSVENATLDGQPLAVSPFVLRRIDALTKRGVIQAVMSAYSVTVED